MKTLRKPILYLIAAISLIATLAACSSTGDKHSTMEKASTTSTSMEIYEVVHDGRINVFYDRALYNEFLSLGETSYRLTHIGAGPNGETVVYGLTKKDKKKPAAVEALKVYEGKSPAPANFYAELRNHGRIYVFNNLEDMKPVRQFGHPNFFFTEIGAGPKGETVVYVLNKKTKKNRPDALIAQFKTINKQI